jgi:hypothetical protein
MSVMAILRQQHIVRAPEGDMLLLGEIIKVETPMFPNGVRDQFWLSAIKPPALVKATELRHISTLRKSEVREA